jgi:hypothetical protein
MFSRRGVFLPVAVPFLVAPAAHAHDYPLRPIVILYGQTPASGLDIMVGLYAEVIGKNIGQRVEDNATIMTGLSRRC